MLTIRTSHMVTVMELGFVEDVENPEELTCAYYPSKVGGRVAWLDVSRIPGVEILTCRKCGKTLIHLLQIQSSPSPSAQSDYHRALFLFVCPDFKCHSPGDSSSFLVLRCELDERNSRHGVDTEGGSLRSDSLVEPANDDGSPEIVSNTSGQSVGSNEAPFLCVVCGSLGPKHCGKCKRVHYCSRNHQVHDWRAGHKQVCSDIAEGKRSPCSLDYDPSLGVALPELEIVTELEPTVSEREEERNEEERMKDYHKFLEENRLGRGSEAASVEELEKMASTEKESNKRFRAFKKRVSVEPTQVLRYQRNGKPLYVSEERIPEAADIPDCQCGAKRTFELQVMPQLLYYLKLDRVEGTCPAVPGAGIDWGTLLVYTCSSQHCSLGPGYHTEFLWKQDIL